MSQHVWRKKSYLSVWQAAEDAILLGPVSKETKPKKTNHNLHRTRFNIAHLTLKAQSNFFPNKKTRTLRGQLCSATARWSRSGSSPRGRNEGLLWLGCLAGAGADLTGPSVVDSSEITWKSHGNPYNMDIYENHGSDMEISMSFPKINTGHDSNVYNNCSDPQSLNMFHKARLYYILSYWYIYGDKHYITNYSNWHDYFFHILMY